MRRKVRCIIKIRFSAHYVYSRVFVGRFGGKIAQKRTAYQPCFVRERGGCLLRYADDYDAVRRIRLYIALCRRVDSRVFVYGNQRCIAAVRTHLAPEPHIKDIA